jgi:hypothetical protein
MTTRIQRLDMQIAGKVRSLPPFSGVRAESFPIEPYTAN